MCNMKFTMGVLCRMSELESFDVGIIGGGPAGSALAAYLAREGMKCVVLEAEKFPRPHVGESLVPASTRVFKDLDFLDKMEEAGFVHKFGAVWTADDTRPLYEHDWEGLDPDCAADIRFEERAQEGVDINYTYHVDRAKFDQLLLEHAAEFGATVREECRVMDVDFSHPKGQLITYREGKDKRERQIETRLVVDASGRKTLLGRLKKIRVLDPVFDQYACHTWFDNYDRTKTDTKGGHGDHIFIHFLPVSNSWVWQIPIAETVTSIGVVTQKKNFQKSKQSREEFFWKCLESRPVLYSELKKADQVNPLTDEGDYSYSMKEICGDGWVLIGDAARFVDPIFSSGVSIALNSAKLVSSAILEARDNGGVFSKSDFDEYETIMRRGTRNWHSFITVYYRLNVLFTWCLMNPKYRLDILKLLQGDVYDEEEPPVLAEMRKIVEEVESNPKHVWHNLLNDLTNSAFEPSF
jgi:1H-pyrrole-2-carbonyl-[peptidyl-carrier protein] chlorinase